MSGIQQLPCMQKKQKNITCNEKNYSTETDRIEITKLKDRDIKSDYDVFHVFKKVGENMSILIHERCFL